MAYRLVRPNALGTTIEAAEVAADVATQAELDALEATKARDVLLSRFGAFGGAVGITLTGDLFFPVQGDYAGHATEANVSIPAPKAGTVLEVLVKISANTLTATAAVMHLRAAGASLANVNLLTAGTGIVSMTITDADFAAGEALSLMVDITTHTGGNITIDSVATRIKWS